MYFCIFKRHLILCEGGWQWTYGVASPVALVMFIGMSYLPYSARWLALKGRITEAKISLQFVIPLISESDMLSIREAGDKAASSRLDNDR